MYVFDTDLLIRAYRDDFSPKGSAPASAQEFWKWLNGIGSVEGIVIPEKVIEEIAKKTDGLKEFISKLGYLKKEPTTNCMPSFGTVMASYGSLSEEQVEILSKKADPYVIAHASVIGATVVSCEVREPMKIGINKKIPDICTELKIPFESYPSFLWRMRGKYP